MGEAARTLLPHALSLSRPLLGLVLLAAVDPRRESAVPLVLALAAVATDWLDGRAARRLGSPGAGGRVVDGACDFVFLACAFAFLARGGTWTSKGAGLLAPGADWVPLGALLLSFGVYALRLGSDLAAGRESGRSPAGHAAGVANWILVVGGAAVRLPGAIVPGLLVEVSVVLVALLNLLAVPENLRLMFLRTPPGPRINA